MRGEDVGDNLEGNNLQSGMATRETVKEEGYIFRGKIL